MNAQIGLWSSFRSAIIDEYRAEFDAHFRALLDVARIYGHALVCDKCRKHAGPMAGVCANAASAVGAVLQRSQIVNVTVDELLPQRPVEISYLLKTCVELAESCTHPEKEGEPHAPLALCSVLVATAAIRAKEMQASPAGQQ
jgi:hypothetical protein